MRVHGGIALVAVFALVAGCRSRTETSYSSYDHYSNWMERTTSTTPGRTSRDRPRLALSDAEIEAALANHRTQEAQRREALVQVSVVSAPSPSDPPQTDVDAEMQVRSCYQIGARDAAEVVIARHPSVYTWDQAQDVIEISTSFERGSSRGVLAVSMTRRPGVQGELVIAIPPGTFAVPVSGLARKPGEGKTGEGARPRRWTSPDQQRRFQHWPPAQDLALLRAPVVRISDHQHTVVTRIPVACASFRIGAPKHGQPMALDRFEPDSKIDRLMIALCSGPAAPSSEAQLAVWLARDDLAWNEFVAKGGRYGGLITFDRQRVLPRHGSGASLLLLEAGIDPRTQSKFYEVVTPPAPSAPAELDEQAWPEFDDADPAPPLTPAPPSPVTIG